MRKVQILKITALVAGLAGILAVGGFELFYQNRITNCAELPLVEKWIVANRILDPSVGQIANFTLQRESTSYYISSEGTKGSFHLEVSGSIRRMDILVTWHKKDSDPVITVEKVEEWLSPFQLEPLWHKR